MSEGLIPCLPTCGFDHGTRTWAHYDGEELRSHGIDVMHGLSVRVRHCCRSKSMKG